MQKKLILSLLLSFFLTGCDTVMTQDQMNKDYGNYNINQFVKKRYAINQEGVYSTIERLTSPIGKAASLVTTSPHIKTIDDYTYQILDDGKSVLFPLSFNDYNDHFLFKPLNEAQEFCRTQGGVLYINKIYNINFNGLKENPLAQSKNAYNETQTGLSFQYIDIMGNDQTVTIDNDFDKSLMAESTFIQSTKVNQSTISQIYQQAIKRNAFGIYFCRKNDSILWKIKIKPVYYMVSSEADHDLYVLISPEMN